MVVMEFNFSGKSLLDNSALLVGENGLIGGAIRSVTGLGPNAERALKWYVQSPENFSQLVHQVFVTDDAVNDDLLARDVGVPKIVQREPSPGKILIKGQRPTSPRRVHVVVR